MALTEGQKARLAVAVSHLRREASWMTIRQFCVAESASDEPDYRGLRDHIINLVGVAIDEDIQTGIDARMVAKK